MSGRVEGKVALITGAARGQGRSHAIRLAEEGADIIAVDVCKQLPSIPYPLATADDLAETVDLVKAAGGRIIASQVDVRDFAALKDAADEGVREFGRLDIVSANAGVVNFGETVAFEEAAFAEVIGTNLTGVWHTAKACVPHIRSGGAGGSIVVTSSAAGQKAYAGCGPYVPAKHGLIGIARTLAVELGPEMIRVNCILPTQVRTGMSMNDVSWKLFCPDIEEPTIDDFAAVSQAMHVLPVPWVEPVDISNALLFLVSDEGRYITGAALPVDCGVLIK